MYALLFLVGFFGFLGLAALSAVHSGHHSHSHGHADGGLDATGHAHAGTAFHGAKGGAGKAAHSHHAHGKGGLKGMKFRPWWALTPFDILAYCTGAGAVGEILRQAGQLPNLVLGAAILGALAFNFVIAKPLLNALLKFESRQSDGLEGSVAQEVEALTRFDAQGRGLVLLHLDGQIIQILGILEREERERGVTVAKGDRLWVVSIDAAKNTCRVTRELAA